jgi:hypothetical protein
MCFDINSFALVKIAIITMCASSCLPLNDDLVYRSSISYISSWSPSEADGESFDMIDELRNGLDHLNVNAIYVPKGELDQSVKFSLLYRNGRLAELVDSSGAHYKLTNKISREVQNWVGSDGENDAYSNAKIIAVPVHDSNLVVAVAIDGGPFFKGE